MNKNINTLIEQLEINKTELVERFEARKREYINSLQNSSAGQILSQYNYTEYTKLMDVARELNELEAKLRTIYYTTHLLETDEKKLD